LGKAGLDGWERRKVLLSQGNTELVLFRRILCQLGKLIRGGQFDWPHSQQRFLS